MDIQPHLALLLETIHEPVIGADDRFSIQYWNAAAENVFGLPASQVIGANLWQALRLEASAAQLELAQALIQQDGKHQFDGVGQRADGQRLALRITAVGLKQPDGSLLGYAVTIRDFTELKRQAAEIAEYENRFRQREERDRRLVEHAKEGFWTLDTAGNTDFINRQGAEILGDAVNALTGRPCADFLFPEDLPAWQQRLDRCAQGITENGTIRLRHTSGRTIWVDASTTPIYGDQDEYLGVLVMFQDITERTLAEQKLQEALKQAAWLARLPEENPNPVARATAGSVVLYRNPAAASLTGWACQVGQPLPDALHGLVAQAMRSGQEAQQDIQVNGVYYSVSVMSIASEGYANIYGRDISARKRAEEALRASEERLIDVLESTHEFFMALDHSYQVVYINRRFAKTLGRYVEDLIGKNFWEEFPRYRGTPVEHHYRKAEEERVPVHFELAGVYTPYWFDVSVYPTKEGISVFANDRTEEKRANDDLQAAYARLKSYVDANIIGIVRGMDDGSMIEVNDYYLNLIGYTRADFEAGLIDWKDITPPEYRPLDLQAIAEMKERGVCTPYQKEYFRKDGTRVWVSLSDALLPDGSIAAFVQDMTELKHAQASLQETAEKLKRSNQELEQFAFVASHDLQEPLRKVKQFGNSIQRRLAGKLDEDAQEYFTRMTQSIDRMQAMIADLLELSRVNRSGQPFVDVDLSKVLADVLSDLEVQVRRTRGQVTVGPLPVIKADPVQIHQVFQNLIGNALKFHPADRPPSVRIWGEVQSAKLDSGYNLLIQVEDNGIGFEEIYFNQILQPFKRLHGRSEYEGTGMGLAIVKKIIDRHQGQLSARSTPGEGSTFQITLPFKPGE